MDNKICIYCWTGMFHFYNLYMCNCWDIFCNFSHISHSIHNCHSIHRDNFLNTSPNIRTDHCHKTSITSHLHIENNSLYIFDNILYCYFSHKMNPKDICPYMSFKLHNKCLRYKIDIYLHLDKIYKDIHKVYRYHLIRIHLKNITLYIYYQKSSNIVLNIEYKRCYLSNTNN